ncbi:MAG: hypothetical protein HY013_16835 [Candidatus Solibacter usitatus]|nr:hypothetical protein [Candidatus Solibacter usitatus]
MPRPSLRMTLSRLLIRVLPFGFIAFVLFCGLVGFPAPGAQTGGAPKDPLAEVNAKVDSLKWNLTLILAAAGLFTVAQSAAAFFSAQTFVRQADDAIKRVQEIAADAKASFPAFGKAEQARRDAYRVLATTFDSHGLDWRNELYDRIRPFDRQRLMSVERFIGLEFLDWTDDPEEHARNLRRLANFYASKFRSEGRTYKGDLERAEYYLELACEMTQNQFYLLSDLGLLNMEFKIPRELDRAKEFFERSRAKNPHQQRALYNLAVAATYEQPKRYDTAAGLLTEALKEKPWEQTEVPEMTCNVYYNLACARAQQAKAGGADAPVRLEECFQALEKAASIGQVRKSTVDGDADQSTGELYEVANSPDQAVQERFGNLRMRLYTKQPPVAKDTFKERFSAAWKALKGEA